MKVEDIIIRLVLAVLIGGAIGYEREFKNRPAGFRTHILVCVGATIISLIQVSMAENAIVLVTNNPDLAQVIKVDYARLGAQVITGVGFLGAGTIMHTKGSIRGLTTAASLWVVACIGLSVGMGYYYISIFGVVFIAIVLGVLKKFQNRFITQAGLYKIEIQYINKEESIFFLKTFFEKKNITIKELKYIGCDEREFNDEVFDQWSEAYTISIPKYIDMNELISKISFNKNIMKVKSISN
ncbi:MgtC/SapB family protein [Clostridium ganghwense]|uniref:MgtC/SapB family protein n=1 Tax=Clostridium ganghwense TaxID=312089 RepID=A0ABT4CS76_9CLOT|nr:MgtC/SapB family protein [Clostridium ganghwense]MCY6371066.1 MgtC/SapB family protein [Clostridium ganghwense]